MIITNIERQGKVFDKSIRDSQNDLKYLRFQLNECTGETEEVFNQVSEIERRITNNEDFIGFKTYTQENGDEIIEANYH